MREFDADAFRTFRHGYAGTIYKGQGRTLDQTYLYHSEHWRSAASYVALTRHRDKAELFVATNTARDVSQLSRQMARVDDRRAASQFHVQPRALSGEARQAAQADAGASGNPAERSQDQPSTRRQDEGSARGRYAVLGDALREARELAEAARRQDKDERDRDLEPDRDLDIGER